LTFIINQSKKFLQVNQAMDKGVSIERRLEAIIERAKGQCNLVWLENLNLRGDYRPVILDWIHENHPELDELYYRIYSKKDHFYHEEVKKSAKK